MIGTYVSYQLINILNLKPKHYQAKIKGETFDDKYLGDVL